MATIAELKTKFRDGYSSGDILSVDPDELRARRERTSGCDYLEIFHKAIAPHIAGKSQVLEIGPGRGSWTKSMLSFNPECTVHALDFLDLTQFFPEDLYDGRLKLVRIQGNTFKEVPNDHFDFFWSFGVLCHCEMPHVQRILERSLMKVKPGCSAIHQHGEWGKTDRYEKGLAAGKPWIKWWPRNTTANMVKMAKAAGWEVVEPDMGLIDRDGLIHLRRPIE